MHVREITAFAQKVGHDAQYKGKQVVIKAPADKGGKYLTSQGKFEGDKAQAHVYDYDRDRVGDQLQQCHAAGMNIEIELA